MSGEPGSFRTLTLNRYPNPNRAERNFNSGVVFFPRILDMVYEVLCETIERVAGFAHNKSTPKFGSDENYS